MPSDKRLYPLATCSIGIWRSPDRTKSYLLLLPEKKLFVILLAKEFDAQGAQQDNALSVNGLLCRVRNQVSLWLRHKNPFVDHTPQPDRDTSVLTFEISWADIVGIDFKWPLTEDARLVLEASLMAKRVFDNVEAVCLHYQPQPRASRRPRVSTLQQLAASAASVHGSQQQEQQQHHRLAGKEAAAPAAIAPSTSSSSAAAGTSNSCTAGAAAAARETAAAAEGAGGGSNEQGHVTNKLHAAVAASDAGLQGTQGGSISRVSSWTSWASWTSGRSSLEQTPTAAAAAAAAAGSGASAAQQQHFQEQQPLLEQPQRCSQQEKAAGEQAVGGPEQHQQQQQLEQECSFGSHIRPAALLTAPTLQSGIGAGSRLVEAVTAEPSPSGRWRGSSCIAQESTLATLQELQFADMGASPACDCMPAPYASPHSAVAAAAAGRAIQEQEQPTLWPLRGRSLSADGAAAGDAVSSGASDYASGSTVLPDAAVHFTVAAGSESTLSCEASAASFGFWARPVKPIRVLLDRSPAGCVTAPCSMPGSPRLDAGASEGLLEQLQQPLLHLYQQQQGQAVQQKRGPDNSRGSSSASRSSRMRTAAAAADRSCPLCNQPLLQPLHVLQQRFHDKQQYLESRHARSLMHNGNGGKPRHPVGKSKSACSLEQLLQQAKTAGSSSHSGNQQQHPVGVQQQQHEQQQQPGSAKSLAGRAAAAVGGLAARCIAAASGSRISSCNNAATSPAPTAAAAGVATCTLSTAVPGSPVQPTGMELNRIATDCDTAVCSGTAESALAAADAGAPAVHLAGEEAAEAEAHAAAASAAADSSSGAADCTNTRQGAQAAPVAAVAVEVAAKVPAAVGLAASSEPPVVTAAGAAAASAFAAASTSGSQCAPEGQCEYTCRTVVMTFKDPTLPHQLKRVVNSNVRLLKLYESGLPGWAVLLPSYGLWYRPWLRRVTWLLFVVLSVVSMAMGFYDLYKNVPYFKQAIIAMFSPAAAVFEWLEHHTQIRLSILLTYMLGKSQLVMQLIKLLTQTSMQPIIAPIVAVLKPLGAALSATADNLVWLAQPFVALGRLVVLLLQLLWQPVSVLLWSGPLQLVMGVAQGLLSLLQLLLLPVQALLPGAATIRAGWAAAKATGQAAKAAAPVVKGAAATASHAAKSSWSLWGWWWSPLEALELMRISTMRIVRALQAVVKFFVTMGSTLNQHRLSLMLQLRQQLWGGLRAAADSPAGRVASAVALKMGQEERVARLHQRLRRSDSVLISTGSELLPADSAAVSTVLSLEGELSIGLTEDPGRSGRVLKEFHGDAGSDDEVTSGGTEAPVSPAQVYSSSGGLRHRGAAAVDDSHSRVGSLSRFGHGGGVQHPQSSAAAAANAEVGLHGGKQHQQQQQLQSALALRSLRVGSVGSKQVTFASSSQQQQHHSPAAPNSCDSSSRLHEHQSLGADVAAAAAADEGMLRVSLDTAQAGAARELEPYGYDGLLLRVQGLPKAGGRPASSLGHSRPVVADATGSDVVSGSSSCKQQRSVSPQSPGSSQVDCSADRVVSGVFAVVQQNLITGHGVNKDSLVAAAGAVGGYHGGAGSKGSTAAAATVRRRRSSWG